MTDSELIVVLLQAAYKHGWNVGYATVQEQDAIRDASMVPDTSFMAVLLTNIARAGRSEPFNTRSGLKDCVKAMRAVFPNMGLKEAKDLIDTCIE